MIGMAFGIGFVVAPAIGGFLGEINVRLPFWAAVVMCLTNFVYGLFVLPESLPKEKRTPHFDWAHANPFGALKLLRRYPQVLGLIGVLFLMALAHMVYPTTFVLYADYRFGWGPQMVGYTLAGVGVLAAIVQGGLIKKIVGALGERHALLFGLACGTLGFALYGLAPTWLLVLDRDADRRALGRRRAGCAGDHDAPRRPARTGPPSRCLSRACRRSPASSRRPCSRARSPRSRRQTCTAPGPASRSVLRRSWSAAVWCLPGTRSRTCRRQSRSRRSRRRRSRLQKSLPAVRISSRRSTRTKRAL
jgi:hypothetical protein